MAEESPTPPGSSDASPPQGVPPGPPPPPPPPAGAAPPPPPHGGGAPGGGTPGGGTPGGPRSENRTLWLILAYFGPLALIPFLLEKEDAEVQWHSKHGLVLFLAEVAMGILFGIVSIIIGSISAFGCLEIFTGCIFPVVFFFAILILHGVCIMKALDGRRFLIPNLSHFADQF